MERPLALVVDSDPAIRAFVRDVLQEKGIETVGAGSGQDAIDVLRTRPVAILLADSGTPGVAASDLPRQALRLRPTAAFIVLGGDGPDAALAAVRLGALDVIGKPIDENQLRMTTEKAARWHHTMEELSRLRNEAGTRAGTDLLVGRTPVMERLRSKVESLGGSETPVLFVGEKGTGKQAAARYLHSLSARKDKAFVRVDGTSPGLASDLERIIGAAAGGTLFLAEVADMPLEIQEHVIRLLDERSGDRGRSARLTSSSSRDIERAVQEGRLREDLHRMLAGTVVELPALRSRPEDVPVLARHILDTIRSMNQLGPIHLSPEAMELLERYSWPGNVRELRSAIEQATILADEGTIRPRDLPERIRGAEPATPAAGRQVSSARRFRESKREVVEAFERSYLHDLLVRHGGNVTAAAHQAGMLRSALQRLLRKYGLRSADYRHGKTAVAAQGPMES